MSDPVVYIYSSNTEPTNTLSFKAFLKKIAQGAYKDFLITNGSSAVKKTRTVAGIVGASPFAQATKTLTPMKWLYNIFIKRNGALPIEYISTGTLQVFQFSAARRVAIMAGIAAAKFVVVLLAYDGGILIGATTNQFLSQDTKDSIGGTINQIIYEEGWRELWKHPFGHGLCWGR